MLQLIYSLSLPWKPRRDWIASYSHIRLDSALLCSMHPATHSPIISLFSFPFPLPHSFPFLHPLFLPIFLSFSPTFFLSSLSIFSFRPFYFLSLIFSPFIHSRSCSSRFSFFFCFPIFLSFTLISSIFFLFSASFSSSLFFHSFYSFLSLFLSLFISFSVAFFLFFCFCFSLSSFTFDSLVLMYIFCNYLFIYIFFITFLFIFAIHYSPFFLIKYFLIIYFGFLFIIYISISLHFSIISNYLSFFYRICVNMLLYFIS